MMFQGLCSGAMSITQSNEVRVLALKILINQGDLKNREMKDIYCVQSCRTEGIPYRENYTGAQP